MTLFRSDLFSTSETFSFTVALPVPLLIRNFPVSVAWIPGIPLYLGHGRAYLEQHFNLVFAASLFTWLFAPGVIRDVRLGMLLKIIMVHEGMHGFMSNIPRKCRDRFPVRW